jgi:hypothetical protein
MSEVPPVLPARAGIPCPSCGGVCWRTTCTRKAARRVRRWRTCRGCGHTVRTVELVEATSPARAGGQLPPPAG